MSLKPEQNTDTRTPRTFKIAEADLKGGIPDSIESDKIENPPQTTGQIDWDQYPQPLFSKAMKFTAIGIGGLLGLTIVNDLISMINSASTISSALGIAVTAVLAALAILSGVGLFQWIKGTNDIQQIA